MSSTSTTTSSTGAVTAPSLRARWVALRPIRDGDLNFVYVLMSSPDAGGRVRYAGATPSPEQVAASLWESVLAQFVVEKTSTGEPIGLVAITSPNFRDGFAYLSALGLPEKQGTGLLATATMLGMNYAFTTWPFRKIYMEANEDSYRQFASGLGTYFQEEGRLREHVFWNARYVDLLILAVYREVWASKRTRLLVALGALEDPGLPSEERLPGGDGHKPQPAI